MKTFEGRKVIEEQLVYGLEGSENVYKYLPGKLISIPSRKGVKKAFSRRQILVNGHFAKSFDIVSNNDQIKVLEYIGTISKEYDLDLNILYEDDFIAIVEKPPGIPTSGNKWKTLQNAIPGNVKGSKQGDALSVPLTVHRLDAKTHGLVIIAKTSTARIRLGEMFEQRKIQKTYTAIVQGEISGDGIFESDVDGKHAITHYRAKESFAHVKDKWNTILELSPETGRKHQLRVHLSEAGHPIVGDVKYSSKSDVLKGKGFFLSANRIEFQHPITNEKIEVATDLPNKFNRYIDRMERWYKRVNEN